MKYIANLVTLFVFLSFRGESQECFANQRRLKDPRSYYVTHIFNRLHLPGFAVYDSAFSELEQRVFRFGVSLNGIFGVNPGVSPSQGLTWFDDQAAIQLDVSLELDSWHQWLAGFSFGFQRLMQKKQPRTFSPEEYLSGSDLQQTRALTVDYIFNANTYSPMFYTEYILVTLGEFSGFVRAETGSTIYSAGAKIAYKYESGKRQVPVVNRDLAASFNAGIGLGVRLTKGMFEFKLAAIYQAQTKVRFRSQQEYENYTFHFDASEYDFKEAPSDSEFTIIPSGDGTARRYSPFYIQLGICIRGGEKE